MKSSMHVEGQHYKYVPCSRSESPIANLKHSKDSHTPFTKKLKLEFKSGIRKLTPFNFKSSTLKIQVSH